MSNENGKSDEVMTAREVATLLKMHNRSVYKLTQSGEIPGSKVGGGWRFLRSEIMELLKAKPKSHN